MMGEVPGDLRGQLKDVIIAIGLRDSQRLVRCMEELHMLLPSADRSLLERAVGQLFDRFGGMSLAEMRELDPKEFIDFGRQFRDLMREMPFQLPEDFLLLIRAASLMNGLCTALDPDYNLWDSVQPYADQLVTGDPGAVRGAVARRHPAARQRPDVGPDHDGRLTGAAGLRGVRGPVQALPRLSDGRGGRFCVRTMGQGDASG